ncbi:phage holin family protein [Mongoliitalea lutea]|uniref:Holin-X, holin superfamily III n=1 Tax=Mongoliitalea lutea TaxID=849756 RepID=A0A8J3G673_9BACT|nr:phage holin family protein [Mongoliitalea lutea]GHB41752.1 hypothetical protein GCM10008106_23420 [Mongoliitalea lutea]
MFNISEIVQTIKQLIEVRINMVKNEISEQVSIVLTRIFLLVLMGVFSVMILLFMSLSLAFYLSDLMYSSYKGFLLVAILYLIVFLIFFLARDSRSFGRSLKAFLRAFIFGENKTPRDDD